MENKLATLEAYYMVAKNGGFQIRKVTIEEGIVLEDIHVDDPDAWDQAVNILEQQLSNKFK